MESAVVNLPYAVWRHRYTVLLTAFICGVCAAAASYGPTPIYKAAAVVTQVEDRDAAKRKQVTSGSFAALANLSGLDPLGELTANARVQQVLRSRQLAAEFIRRNDLASELLPRAKQPVSLWFAAKRLRERVVYVFEDRLKGTTTVSMEWPDAKVAARWANSYVALANELIRNSDLQSLQRKVAYLKEQAATSDALDLQRYLYHSIEQEVETAMLANGRTEYAFSVVDPATAPELRIRPPRTLITVLGATAGLFAAVVIVFARYALKLPGAGRRGFS